MGSAAEIDREGVAALLGVSQSGIDRMMAKGTLRVKAYRNRCAVYCVEEVTALKEAREKKLGLAEVTDTAKEAWAAARVAQRRVDALERLMGVHIPAAHQLSRDDVIALHLEAKEDLKKKINGAERVNYWADRLVSMCEQYFRRVAEATEDKEEPWRTYQELATALLKNQDMSSTFSDPEEAFAYQRLHVARKQLKYAIFMYILLCHGPHKAAASFPADFRGEDYVVTQLAVAASRR